MSQIVRIYVLSIKIIWNRYSHFTEIFCNVFFFLFLFFGCLSSNFPIFVLFWDHLKVLIARNGTNQLKDATSMLFSYLIVPLPIYYRPGYFDSKYALIFKELYFANMFHLPTAWNFSEKLNSKMAFIDLQRIVMLFQVMALHAVKLVILGS